MQRLYHLFLVLILLIVAVLFLSVIHAEDISKTKLLDRIKKRDKIERNILPFNPEYFKKTQAQHIIIFFDVINGRLIASDKKAIIRPGRRPHHPFSGNFVVVCKTSEGEIIDRFFINDPTIIHSVDAKESIRLQTVTNIMIVIPMNRSIKFIEMGQTDKKELTSYNVEKIIDNAIVQD